MMDKPKSTIWSIVIREVLVILARKKVFCFIANMYQCPKVLHIYPLQSHFLYPNIFYTFTFSHLITFYLQELILLRWPLNNYFWNSYFWNSCFFQSVIWLLFRSNLSANFLDATCHRSSDQFLDPMCHLNTLYVQSIMQMLIALIYFWTKICFLNVLLFFKSY